MTLLLRCEICGAQVTHLRRGRCSVCYLRWAESRPVPQAANCIVCNERRRDFLRQVEFQRTWLTMCHNCSGRAANLRPVPRSLEALRQRMLRDRRWNDRRANGSDERLAPHNRRNIDRRLGSGLGDETIFLDAEDLIVEVIDSADSASEYTRIAVVDPPAAQTGDGASS